MKLFKQKFTTILLTLAFLFGAVSTVNFAMKTEAATLNSGSFTIVTPSDPLFSDLNIAPGYLNAKTVQVTNNGADAKDFSIALSNLSGDLKNVLKIRAEVGGEVKFDKTLTNIALEPNNERVTNVPVNQTVTVVFTAYLPTEVGNNYQGKSVSFDFVMGGSVEGSGGEYTDPVIVPVIGPPATPPVSPVAETGQVSGVGGQSATTDSRARNLALGAQGLTSNSAEAPVVVENTPKTGEVLGTTLDETKGEETSGKNVCFWWWVLSIIYALLLLIYGWIFYKRELMFDWVWPIVGGVSLYFLHWYLHNFYTPSKCCPYFVWFELFILILYYMIYSYYKNRAEKSEEKK